MSRVDTSSTVSAGDALDGLLSSIASAPVTVAEHTPITVVVDLLRGYQESHPSQWATLDIRVKAPEWSHRQKTKSHGVLRIVYRCSCGVHAGRDERHGCKAGVTMSATKKKIAAALNDAGFSNTEFKLDKTKSQVRPAPDQRTRPHPNRIAGSAVKVPFLASHIETCPASPGEQDVFNITDFWVGGFFSEAS